MLYELDIDTYGPSREQIAILVGPNGTGKSTYLRSLALAARRSYDIAIICNTVHDRYRTLRHIPRLSAVGGGSSPNDVIKRAIMMTLDVPDSRFYHISKVLDQCGYASRLGFRLKLPKELPPFRPLPHEVEVMDDEDRVELETAYGFLARRRYEVEETIWIDPSTSAFEFSRSREFANVLRKEGDLLRLGFLKRIEIYLERKDGIEIPLAKASSGEISLISSLIFLVSMRLEKPMIIIDEPENSLHPAWQRSYVETVLAAMPYRNPIIVMATHAPLVVTGAVSALNEIVSVFAVRNTSPRKLVWSKGQASRSVEEVLWEAFEVVTPANHFVSETLSDAFDSFEEGEIEKADVLKIIDDMESHSFDDKQLKFFEAAKALLEKVETTNSSSDPNNG